MFEDAIIVIILKTIIFAIMISAIAKEALSFLLDLFWPFQTTNLTAHFEGDLKT